MTFVQSAVVQYDVLRALILRETRTQHGESRLGYLWAFVDPVVWVMMFYVASEYGGRGRVLHGMGLLPFLATGVCTFKMFTKVSSSVPGKIPDRLLAIPLVTALDVFLAKAALQIATMTFVFVLLVYGATLVSGAFQPVDDPLRVVVGMALASLLGFGYGLLTTAGARVSAIASSIRSIVNRLMFWTSGMFYLAADLPSSAREIFLYNPVLHSVELVRDGWFTNFDSVYADGTYALFFALILLLAGLICERLTRQRVL